MKRILLLNNVLAVIIMVMICTCLTSCGDDGADIVSNSSGDTHTEYEKRLMNQLIGTSWNITKAVESHDFGERTYTYNSIRGILTFVDNKSVDVIGAGGSNGGNVSGKT